MCLKHLKEWNKLIVKQKFCASSWLITETNILRCMVSKTSKHFYLCLPTFVDDAAFVLQCRQKVKWFQNNGHVYTSKLFLPLHEFLIFTLTQSNISHNNFLVNNQFDAQFFLVRLFLFSTCFGQPCAHHQENYCINATPGLCHSV